MVEFLRPLRTENNDGALVPALFSLFVGFKSGLLVGDAGNDIRLALLSTADADVAEADIDPTRMCARAASAVPPPAITRLGDGVTMVRQLAAIDSRRSRTGGVSEPRGNAMAVPCGGMPVGVEGAEGRAVEENREKKEPNLP